MLSIVAHLDCVVISLVTVVLQHIDEFLFSQTSASIDVGTLKELTIIIFRHLGVVVKF